MDSIAHLPLLQILDELATPDLFASAQVCRRWRDVLADPARWARAGDREKWAHLRHVARAGNTPTLQLAIARFRVAPSMVRQQMWDHVGANRDLSAVQWLAAACGIEQYMATTASEYMHERAKLLLPLKEACRAGNGAVARWMLDRFKPSLGEMQAGTTFSHDGPSCVLSSCCWGSDRSLLEHVIARYSLTAQVARLTNLIRAAGFGPHAEYLVLRLGVTPERLRQACVVHMTLEGVCGEAPEAHAQLRALVTYANMDRAQMISHMSMACQRGGLASVQWLAERCAATKADVDGCELLVSASHGGHVPIMDWLVRTYGAEMHHRILLAEACRGGHLDVVRWLAQHDRAAVKAVIRGLAPNPSSEHAEIYTAAANGNPALLQLLVEIGEVSPAELLADSEHTVDVRCFRQLEENSTEGVKWLLECVGGHRPWVMMAMRAACHRGVRSLVRWILDRYALTEDEVLPRTPPIAWSPWYIAASRGQFELLRLFVSRFNVERSILGHMQIIDTRRPRDEVYEDELLALLSNFDLVPENINYFTDFEVACRRGMLRLAKAIYAVAPQRLLGYLNGAHAAALSSGHDDVVHWLAELSRQPQ